MPNIDLTELLERHGVKTTANRLIVAKALLTEGRPLSLMELEDKIGTIDKSGIFRSLTLFKEHHLVHAIEDGGDGTLRALPEPRLSARRGRARAFFLREVPPHLLP